MTRIGVVGAGRMGRPMVRRLTEAGHEVRVLGRSAEARGALAREAAHVVADVADAGRGADIVLVCVYTDAQVREVCLDSGLLDAMPGGAVLVVHTTGSPHTVEAVAARSAVRGIDVLDAPVSGGPPDVAEGRVTLFVGGADDTVARVRPVLRSYGDPVLHVGPLGTGQRVKLVNNTVFAAQIGLLSHASRLGRRLGVDETVLLDALTHGSAASRALSGVVRRGSVAEFARTTGEFLGKDLDVVRAVADELGADLGALSTALDAVGPAATGLNGRTVAG
ncbi:NAD(P)-dependent oxidoreductase [Streptomyces fulvoviolaceus]|uniref:NAD(P)-dependent oxidoreductase n=1 Tax=Streptomyces fulvoviolaceus TaxID=285535 RepID=UPI0009979FAD|nr:NAD(P)-dependent oxidoreductase [Streptomyces fulvoviolaceus]MCT9083289.1 NAD(P)-dependent oxidoreductase [Streptomyces fulvoviolaceus]